MVSDRSRRLWLLDANDLAVRHQWQLGDDAIGAHAVRATDRLALISGLDAVSLLDAPGGAMWRFRHAPWKEGGFERGCAWFDDSGRAFALVPHSGYEGCEVLHLDSSIGEPLHRAVIPTAPAGVHAIHQAGGWVGLSVGEGQDGAFAWWVRVFDDRLEVLDGGWSDEVLFDADPSGQRILTTPHAEGPIKIRSFPDFAVQREIDPPPGFVWDFYACFAGQHIVARAHTYGGDEEILVAIDSYDDITTLAQSEDSVDPGPDGSWIAHTQVGIERWQLDT